MTIKRRYGYLLLCDGCNQVVQLTKTNTHKPGIKAGGGYSKKNWSAALDALKALKWHWVPQGKTNRDTKHFCLTCTAAGKHREGEGT